RRPAAAVAAATQPRLRVLRQRRARAAATQRVAGLRRLPPPRAKQFPLQLRLQLRVGRTSPRPASEPAAFPPVRTLRLLSGMVGPARRRAPQGPRARSLGVPARGARG